MEFNNPELKRVRVCLIGNTKLSSMVHSLIPEFESIAEITIIDSVFNDALLSARRLVEHDAVDVFISAGANAFYLNDTLPIPVVPLKVSESDLVNAVLKAKAISRRILIMTHEHQAAFREFLAYVDGIDVQQRTYSTAEDAKNVFHSLHNQDFGVVIGSSYVCDLAERAGQPFVLLYSRESCRNMVRTAMAVAGRHKRELEQNAFAEFLLAQSQVAKIMTNRADQVIAFNEHAEKLMPRLQRGRRVDRFLDSRFLHTTDTLVEGLILNDRLCRVRKISFDVNEENVGFLYSITAAAQKVPLVEEGYTGLIYKSAKMAQASHFLNLYGATPGAVLLRGETGTGKELAARQIHNANVNNQGPFVAINCAAIPGELFESELFGYADGAFTHSRAGGRSGLLESANNGTFFMDEINSLPIPQQAKLLRVLQEREVRPVGSKRSVALNVKFVAACNHDLLEEVRAGRFREDLYYRLNVFAVNLPPLRERPEDIELLTRRFINRLGRQYQIETEEDELCRVLLPVFRRFHWPGNVRQLENMLERLLVSTTLYPSMDDFAGALPILAPEIFALSGEIEGDSGSLRQVEQEEILKVLDQFAGNKTRTAEYLGISQTTLWRRLKELNAN